MTAYLKRGDKIHIALSGDHSREYIASMEAGYRALGVNIVMTSEEPAYKGATNNPPVIVAVFREES